MIVFGSDYRTPPGHAEPPASAQRLLEIGTSAIAVAAAGLRADGQAAINTIAVLGADGDDAAAQTASALAAKLSAERLLGGDGPGADLIVVGSAPGTPPGRLALSGSSRTRLDASRGSVLVVPSAKPCSSERHSHHREAGSSCAACVPPVKSRMDGIISSPSVISRKIAPAPYSVVETPIAPASGPTTANPAG